uniref:Uncharacterized protein n=1 Tax=Arundo donax TaxID=35708 RepID=A0A0A9GY03_ARUDO
MELGSLRIPLDMQLKLNED